MKNKKKIEINAEETAAPEEGDNIAECCEDGIENDECAENSQQQQEEENKKYNELFDRYQRSLAEFDNYRKRTMKEKSVIYNDGVRDTIEKMLPVFDNFERALGSFENKDDNFYQGIEMISRQFSNVLSELGIETIPAEQGDDFDPNVHFAVAHVEDESLDDNVITEEMQKGYKYKDKIIRPSMVKVAN
jgi:molecular chaperone GrpE